jgi:ribose/xylose/arabinose/galactoside ABC-type transport system permease subunit
MLAGLIVSVVGLSLALIETFDIPRYWTTLATGVALLVAGALRAVARRRRQPAADAP